MSESTDKNTLWVQERRWIQGRGYVLCEPKELPRHEALEAIKYQNVWLVNPMITPPRHEDDCFLNSDVSDEERDTFSESNCTCGIYEIKKANGWAG